MATQDNKTLNMDIDGLCARLYRFIDEAIHCQSANSASIEEWDLNRLKSYVSSALNYRDWFLAVPRLDCPEFHPKEFTVSMWSLDEVMDVENESIKDWARIAHIAMYELANSQSSRIATSLISHDNLRFQAFMDKLVNFMENYMEVTLPLDLPESVPAFASVGEGKIGI